MAATARNPVRDDVTQVVRSLEHPLDCARREDQRLRSAGVREDGRSGMIASNYESGRVHA